MSRKRRKCLAQCAFKAHPSSTRSTADAGACWLPSAVQSPQTLHRKRRHVSCTMLSGLSMLWQWAVGMLSFLREDLRLPYASCAHVRVCVCMYARACVCVCVCAPQGTGLEKERQTKANQEALHQTSQEMYVLFVCLLHPVDSKTTCLMLPLADSVVSSVGVHDFRSCFSILQSVRPSRSASFGS